MLEAERQRLKDMEDKLAEAGRRPDRGGARGVEGGAPVPRRPQGPGAADRLVPVPRARPASARPSWRRRWPSSCSTTRTRSPGSTCPSTCERHTVSRMIGSPPGYVGYDDGGTLAEKHPPPAVSGRPARRGREGASGRAQRAAAGDGGRPPDRRPGPHRGFPPRDPDHDLQPRRRGLAGARPRTRMSVMPARRSWKRCAARSGRSSSTGSTTY